MFQGITASIAEGKRVEMEKQIALKAEVAAHNQEQRRHGLKRKMDSLASQHKASIAEKVRRSLSLLSVSPFRCDLVPASNSSKRGAARTTLIACPEADLRHVSRSVECTKGSGCTLSGCAHSLHSDICSGQQQHQGFYDLKYSKDADCPSSSSRAYRHQTRKAR